MTASNASNLAKAASAATEESAAASAENAKKEANAANATGAAIPASAAEESRYAQSERLLDQALRTIPLGSQTFSKSMTQYPRGVSPYFIARGQGSRVWDVDGNEYVDYVNSLGAVLLGYGDPDVNRAVAQQLENGVSFSLAHPLEVQVSEKLAEMIPYAEMVRFGKNGSDATAGAIRLARAYTGRERVAVCGYHGWQDWYIGSTARHFGVPNAVRELTHTFAYNRLDTLERLFLDHPDAFAAVILEPMNAEEPEPGFLEGVRELCRKHGAVFVLDETITGFRFAEGGAQQAFGVTPDLATFGKGMGNGHPISAIVGRREIMKGMEEIFYSFTFGGETLSLAAALATLTKLQREPVIPALHALGRRIQDGVRGLIARYGLEEALSVGGAPVWSSVQFKDTSRYTSWELKTLYLQEMLARGVLTLGNHNVSYAHSPADADRLLSAYEEVFGMLKEAWTSGDLKARLRCRPLEPLFKVR
ncbi:aminotransferase class III-fold pyridoxal phosphate-dependent enzyme [Cohnella nanjingensis]|uniref:Aminotransferase class III-fold pyridoxal phosphate-dependent enzyme n=1 Tax=Cohnella nanjingensis TaxID=1387779 RepID=A0A7X0RQ92_9BACL|nr:aminotransferase class III-fold pyridoxal phosphate-dependent enzyme [Cohnella nanjingensis]MBB6671699.1 aminotransferase class III-fold pyridoxal phosphate-dependent enzyme [Cohnella nanjingensis]